MHNFSYLRVMFALLIPDGFTQRCDHGITCHCRFRIQYNTYQTALHKGVTTALRATAVFVYSITHTHIRTYLRPHTHSLCFASQKPLVRLSLNFLCIWSVTRRSNPIKTSSWYEAILVMQMKVNDVIMSFVQLRLNLTYRWLVFSQILICCSWDNSLSDKLH